MLLLNYKSHTKFSMRFFFASKLLHLIEDVNL